MHQQGKAAIVTGAAGGVGSALVQLLRRRGMQVIAEDIDPGVAARFAHDDGVVPVIGDVSSAAIAERAVELATERFGGVDVLVNNAGRFHSKPLQETSVDDWDDLMRVNVRGVFVHAKACMPALGRRSGAIVNVASISGLIGLPNQLAYSATKGAIIQMTRQLAIENAPLGVRINAVAPGAIDTSFMAESMKDIPDPEAAMANIASAHPLGKISTPHEVAAVIAFLASEDAGSMTGAIVPVDGGFTAT